MSKISKSMEEEQHSINLIKKTADNKLELNTLALDFIKNIKHDVGVCVCVGPYRQGKSYLLNQLMSRNDLFKVGHKDESQTHGVWLSKTTIKIEDSDESKFTMLIMDTEGLESDDSDSEWDCKLFIFSLLASSLFIYNTKNALDSGSLNKISVVNRLKDKVQLRNSNEEADDDEIKNECPDFMWVVRDFYLKAGTSANEKLNQFLSLETFAKNEKHSTEKNKQNESEIEFRNEIRTNFKSSFKSLNCHYLPVPVSDGTKGLCFEEAIQQLDTIEYEFLREPFRNSMNELRSTIFDTIMNPKRIKNTKINGPLYVEFLKQIVQNLNSDSKIALIDTFESSVKIFANNVLSKLKASYDLNLRNKYVQNTLVRPITFKTLCEIEMKIREETIETLKKELHDLVYDFTEYTNELNINSESVLNEFKDKIKRDISNYNNKVILNKWSDEIQPIYENKSNLQSFNVFITTVNLFKLNVKKDLFEIENVDDFELVWKHLISTVNYDKIINELNEHFRKLELENEAKRNQEKQQNQIRNLYLNSSRYDDSWSSPSNKSYEIDENNNNVSIKSNDSKSKEHLRLDGRPDMRFASNRTHLISNDGIRLKADGTPDMRFKANKAMFAKR